MHRTRVRTTYNSIVYVDSMMPVATHSKDLTVKANNYGLRRVV